MSLEPTTSNATSNATLDRERVLGHSRVNCAPSSCDVAPCKPLPLVAHGNAEPQLKPAADVDHQTSQVEKQTSQAEKAWPTWLVLLAIVVAAILHAIPWLVEGAAWSGWLGIAIALALVRSGGLGSRLWINWIWCSVALGAAFHWSPAAMAYTLSSGIVLGTIVALPLILWDGLRLALGYWLATRISRDLRIFWLVAALTTIACEYVMPSVFPWKLGFVQLSVPWLIQAVDIFGASYSTLVAFAIGGAIQIVATYAIQQLLNKSPNTRVLSEPAGKQDALQLAVAGAHAVSRTALRKLSLRGFLLSPVLLFLVGNALYSSFAWQYWSSISRRAPQFDVALIQVDPSYVESVGNAQALTDQVADRVDLVCWPESSGGNYSLQLGCLADDEQTFALSRHPERGLRPWPTPKCELLLGGKNYVGDGEEPDELYVTAMLIDRGENIAGRYNKRFLMPFGEYLPGESYIPGMAALFDMQEHVEPGKDAQPIPTCCGARIGAMLCYEDMVPQASRQMVASGCNVLISLINGSAFESPFTLYQHRLISQLRSIECRRNFLRCAATGETCVINPLGIIEARLPMQKNDVLIASVGMLEERTIYSRLPWLLPVLSVATLAFVLQRTHRG